eukprot:CAMPEP_0194227912 /NCGR_PEP_ID=MMETSP0156-20130528/43102_1 /TAXON_ID=33649 /ORGANISM="Thalassionema nitzschioides, Strain L26-B" /LENGTH=360 /DNA_ID=CAMNT_0038960409 /DNA_START=114 /DNA_END=1195 /DNA_ORIENTATION=+
MSPEQQQQGRVEETAAVVAPSKEQLDNFLKNLRNSNSIREATDALIVMVEELPSDITSGHYIIMRDADSISRLAARLEALGTILTAAPTVVCNSVGEAKAAVIVMIKELPRDNISGHYIITRDADSISRLAARLEALGTILTAHQQWYAQCGNFSSHTLNSLTQTAGTDSMAWTFIVKIGGMKTILATAKMHETKYDVIIEVVELLWNIAVKADDEIKEEISTDECIDIVLEAMRRWPDKFTILATAKMYETKYSVIMEVLTLLCNIAEQADDGIKEEISTDECIDVVLEAIRRWPDKDLMIRRGCKYLCKISEVDGVKGRLRKKHSLSILGTVLEKNYDSEDEGAYQAANEALDILKAK